MSKKKHINITNGACRYCGQVVQVFLQEGKTAEDYTKEKLQELYNRLIEENPEEAVKLSAQQTLVSDAVNLICSAAIESAQIRMDAHTSFVMGLKSNGEIWIRRTFRGTEEWLF